MSPSPVNRFVLLLLGPFLGMVNVTHGKHDVTAQIQVTSEPAGDELFYSQRALLLLKDRLTPDGVLQLLQPDINSTNTAWHSIIANSNNVTFVPAMTMVQAEVPSKVMNASTFLAWFGADTGNPHKMIGANPEHYVEGASVINAVTSVNIVETWGSLLAHYTIPNYGPGPKQPYMAALPDFPFQAVGAVTLIDGTVIGHIHNSFRDLPRGKDGIEAELYVWLPSGTPDDVVQGLRDHQSIEFSNWLKFAYSDIVSGKFKP